MITNARDTKPLCFYRLTRESAHPGTYYMRPTTGERKYLVWRLGKRPLKVLRTEELRTLAAAQADLAGAAILMKRYCRVVLMATQSRRESQRESLGWLSVPLDYPFRQVKRPPPYR